jgi:hypothetical protein
MTDQNLPTQTMPTVSSSAIGQDANGIQRVPAREGMNVIKLSKSLDENNWTVWKECMKHSLCLCRIEDYAYRKIKCPDSSLQVNNWDFNDNYTQFVIMNNITSCYVTVGMFTRRGLCL